MDGCRWDQILLKINVHYNMLDFEFMICWFFSKVFPIFNVDPIYDTARCVQVLFSNISALFFAYFIILIFSGFDGSNSVHSYSTASLTIDIYAAVFTGFLQPFRLLQIYASGFFSLANCIVDMLS